MSYRCLLFAILLSPSILACPVAEDLNKGIRIYFDDGTWAVYKRDSPTNIIETNFTEKARIDYIYHLHQGVMETRYVEMSSSGTRITNTENYTYDFPLIKAEEIVPGLRLKGIQTGSSKDEDDEVVPYLLRVRDEITINIGKCSYQALPVVSRYDYEDWREWVVVMYLPALGLSFSVETKNDDGVEKYRPIKIQKFGK